MRYYSGLLTAEAVRYLQRLVEGQPVEYRFSGPVLFNPECAVFSPGEEITQLGAASGQFGGIIRRFNPVLERTEALLTLMVPVNGVTPTRPNAYLVILNDPNRNRRAVQSVISLTNSLHSGSLPLTMTLYQFGEQQFSAMAADGSFNAEAFSDEPSGF